MLDLYARALLRALPLAGGGGRGDGAPDLQASRDGVRATLDHLATYDRVCGFRLRDVLPSTYVHVLAFPLTLRLLVDRDFPFSALGAVHVRNRIVQHRPLLLGEPFDVRVWVDNLAPHPRGRTVDVIAEARIGDELAWEGASTYLRRERAAEGETSGGRRENGGAAGGGSAASGGEAPSPQPSAPPPTRARWRVAADTGRRYAAVSGDRNPIHLHALAAKAFGLPGAIAHGMWTKARCLAALEDALPDAYTVDVRFRAPVPLPSTVSFAAGETAFAVIDAGGARTHLEGRLELP